MLAQYQEMSRIFDAQIPQISKELFRRRRSTQVSVHTCRGLRASPPESSSAGHITAAQRQVQGAHEDLLTTVSNLDLYMSIMWPASLRRRNPAVYGYVSG